MVGGRTKKRESTARRVERRERWEIREKGGGIGKWFARIERERERRAWSGKKGWKKAVEEIEEEEEDRASECNWLELALSCQSSSFSAWSLSARI